MQSYLRYAVRLASIATFVILAAGCATEIYREPITFSPATTEKESLLTIAKDVQVGSSAGYQRTLRAGSVWKYVGRVPQGKVYASQNDVLMLEGKHMHEAYCVIAYGSRIVGFYLPVEKAFSPLSPAVPVVFKQ